MWFTGGRAAITQRPRKQPIHQQNLPFGPYPPNTNKYIYIFIRLFCTLNMSSAMRAL